MFNHIINKHVFKRTKPAKTKHTDPFYVLESITRFMAAVRAKKKTDQSLHCSMQLSKRATLTRDSIKSVAIPPYQTPHCLPLLLPLHHHHPAVVATWQYPFVLV